MDCPAGTASVQGNCTPLDPSADPSTNPDGTAGASDSTNGQLGSDGPTGTAGTGEGAAASGSASSGAGAAASGMRPSEPAAGGADASGAAATGAAASGAMAGGPAASGGAGAAADAQSTCGSETCDNLDNDCDQMVDEAVTRPCGPAPMGVCKQGVEECIGGAWTGSCTGAVEPGPEMCDVDGLDENCNGTPNEDCACTPGMTQPCGMKGGICVQGTQTCDANGQWPDECVGAVPPATEECDGRKDEDCDGQVDEDCDCTNGESMPCGSDAGDCAVGMKTCEDGAWSTLCEGEVKPGSESCDGRDNDCDGKTDEGVQNDCGGCQRLTNPPGSSCSAGEFSCRQSGEYVCLGRDATRCNAVARSGRSETCNSSDDDCDGSADEGLENACGGSCRTVLPGSEGGSCEIAGAGGCTTSGTYECSGTSLRCVPKCWYLCVVGTAPATRTQDPCSWTNRGTDTACVPEDPNCF